MDVLSMLIGFCLLEILAVNWVGIWKRAIKGFDPSRKNK